MGDLSTREQIRADAIARIASVIRADHQPTEIGNAGGGYDCSCGEPWLERLYRGCWTRHRADSIATRYVDALGDLLPTGIEWGAALAPDEQPITTVVFGFTGNEEAARTWDHPVRRYTTDWIEEEA